MYCKEIKPVNPIGNRSWIFIGRTDAEAETPILWPSDTNKWLMGKDPDAGKDWGQEEKGMTEDEMVGWHHWLSGHEFEQALEKVKDREAWRAAVHAVANSWIQLSDWTELKGRQVPLKINEKGKNVPSKKKRKCYLTPEDPTWNLNKDKEGIGYLGKLRSEEGHTLYLRSSRGSM